MARGIEKCAIFRDDEDREDFLDRLRGLVTKGALDVYAWALMTTHLHTLVRTGSQPLERSMRSLLGGYATRFNKRHDRVGHLFQNRFKSILCGDERYFLSLVRYIHRNPVKDGLLSSYDELASYPYTGHAALLGTVPREWQNTNDVLAHFGPTREKARIPYEQFVRGDEDEEIREIGALVPAAEGWSFSSLPVRGRECGQANERALGSIDDLLAEMNRGRRSISGDHLDLDDLLGLVAATVSVTPVALRNGGKIPALVRARDGAAFLWLDVFGHSSRDLALRLGVSRQAILKAVRRGRTEARMWLSALARRRA